MAELTAESLPEFVRTHRFAIIHFWAAWNGHDRQVKAFLENELPPHVRDVVKVGTFDVDPPDHHRVCVAHRVLNIPFLVFYRDGLVVDKCIGFPGKDEMLRRLDGLVSAEPGA